MNFSRHIPNLFTSANLICGSIAVVLVSQHFDQTAAIFLIFLAAFFDLLDGAVARALKVSGEFGKQLDSLADVISFGLAPSVVIYQMLETSLPSNLQALKFLAFFNGVCAALRLAKFNISTDQTHDFSGMPSPANGIFWASILAIFSWQNLSASSGSSIIDMPSSNVVIFLLMLTSLLMVSKIRMFSFKFKPGGVTQNMIPVLFIACIVVSALVSLIVWKNILISIPISILAYIALSFVYHFQLKQK
jgi:CDP-diacylglycerol--serine O-phosphatidyltransferase